MVVVVVVVAPRPLATCFFSMDNYSGTPRLPRALRPITTSAAASADDVLDLQLNTLRNPTVLALLACLSATPRALRATTELVDARVRTTVTQNASAYDPKTSSDGGCDPAGCTPDLSRDRSLADASRWSCSEQLNDAPCKITYEFEEPQDIVRLNIKFFKGDQRVRTLNVSSSDGFSKTITSSGSSDGYESFDVNTDETAWLTMEPVDLGSREWISLIEVGECIFRFSPKRRKSACGRFDSLDSRSKRDLGNHGW